MVSAAPGARRRPVSETTLEHDVPPSRFLFRPVKPSMPLPATTPPISDPVIQLVHAQFDFLIQVTDPTVPIDPAAVEADARSRLSADFSMDPAGANYVFRRFDGTACYIGDDPFGGSATALDDLRRVVLKELKLGRTAAGIDDVRLPSLTGRTWLTLPSGIHHVSSPVNRDHIAGAVPWTYPYLANGAQVALSHLYVAIEVRTMTQVAIP